jgi:hypothetical protein
MFALGMLMHDWTRERDQGRRLASSRRTALKGFMFLEELLLAFSIGVGCKITHKCTIKLLDKSCGPKVIL